MADESRTIAGHLLLQYVGLLAERHAYRPEDGFEFELWRDVLNDTHALVSEAESAELTSLVLRTASWVSYDFEAGRLQLIGLREWQALLDRDTTRW
jgi:hypothetical protein